MDVYTRNFFRTVVFVLIFTMTSATGAQTLFLNGDVTLEQGQAVGINQFFIARIDGTGVQAVDIKPSQTYRKALDVGEYANSTLIFDFPFPEGTPRLSLDDFQLKIPPGVQDRSTFTKNFVFFRPAAFSQVVVSQIANSEQLDNCEVFFDLAGHLNDLSELSTDKLNVSSRRYQDLINSSARVLNKVLLHNCSPGRVRPITTAISNFLEFEMLTDLDLNARISVSRDLSWAVRNANEKTDLGKSVLKGTAEHLERIVSPIETRNTTRNDHGDILFAIQEFYSKSGETNSAKRFAKLVLEKGALDTLPDIKGSMLYDYFLILSDAVFHDRGRSVEYRSIIPSNDQFRDLPKTVKDDWCFVMAEYVEDIRIAADWERRKIRKGMREEMQILSDNNMCIESA